VALNISNVETRLLFAAPPQSKFLATRLLDSITGNSILGDPQQTAKRQL